MAFGNIKSPSDPSINTTDSLVIGISCKHLYIHSLFSYLCIPKIMQID